MVPAPGRCRFLKSEGPLPRFFVNDYLGGLDPHVPDGVVPVADAQKGVPESLDQAQSAVLTGLQVLVRLHMLQHGHAPRKRKRPHRSALG